MLVVIGVASSWPSFKYRYLTQIPWIAFIGLAIAGVFFSVAQDAEVAFSAAARASLGRELFRRSVAGFLEPGRGRLLRPEIAQASVRG